MRRGLPLALVRVFLLAAFGVAGAVWALARAYRPKPPMVVPVAPSAVPTEMPAPEIVRDPPSR
ncbi:MAG: hypothetical protein U0235_25535 [Polyangiaceae bacterium]